MKMYSYQLFILSIFIAVGVVPTASVAEEQTNWKRTVQPKQKEPSPLDHGCPDAPMIARICKDNVEPKASSTTDSAGCTQTTYSCPEDAAKAPPGSSSGETTVQNKDSKKRKSGTGQVIQ